MNWKHRPAISDPGEPLEAGDSFELTPRWRSFHLLSEDVRRRLGIRRWELIAFHRAGNRQNDGAMSQAGLLLAWTIRARVPVSFFAGVIAGTLPVAKEALRSAAYASLAGGLQVRF